MSRHCPAVLVDAGPALQAYMLGRADLDTTLALQRRLVYQVSGDRQQGILVLCDHAPLITVGRQGSRAHIAYEPGDLRARQWPVRWVNRGGGCWLHLPGQIALYSVLPLDQLGLNVQGYLDRLHRVLAATVDDFGIRAERSCSGADVCVNGRAIARVGVAVCNWVSSYGAVLNVNVDLEPFRRVRAPGEEPMTSVQRERRGPLRTSMVRERLVEHFAAHFQYPRVSVFFDQPGFSRKAPTDALAASS